MMDYAWLATEIKAWGRKLGFQAIGVSTPDLALAEARLANWLDLGYQGEMNYMASHGLKRSRPAELVPQTLTVVSARMNYLPPDAHDAADILARPDMAFISRYALGRDYHKLLRARLGRLAETIRDAVGPFGYRVFVDSAPVMEVELAIQAGLGWRGKHSMVLSRAAGSWFFIGEIYTDLPLPPDTAQDDHCGSCTACIRACPTGAIVAPYQVDARRCISYLTIELKGSIPESLRPLIGNRVYGCDDCQISCPWNRFARDAEERDFLVRQGLDNATLAEVFSWSAAEFRARMAGSAIWRIGHERWLRNIAVALGNAPTSSIVMAALAKRANDESPIVREHVAWALAQHAQSCDDCRNLQNGLNN